MMQQIKRRATGCPWLLYSEDLNMQVELKKHNFQQKPSF